MENLIDKYNNLHYNFNENFSLIFFLGGLFILSNLFIIPNEIPKEITEILHSNENVRIERIISNGQCSPVDFFYDQQETEWLFLLQGKAIISFKNNEKITLNKGDNLFIPAHKKHRVEKTSTNPPCIWICVYYK